MRKSGCKLWWYRFCCWACHCPCHCTGVASSPFFPLESFLYFIRFPILYVMHLLQRYHSPYLEIFLDIESVPRIHIHIFQLIFLVSIKFQTHKSISLFNQRLHMRLTMSSGICYCILSTFIKYFDQIYFPTMLNPGH